MKTCKSCGKEMPDNQKFCSNCGAANAKPIFKKWWFWTIIVVVIGAVFLFGGNGTSTSASGKSGTSKADDPAGKYQVIAESAQEPFEISDESLDFIKQHQEFFPGSEKNSGAMSDFVDYDADYVHLAKNVAKYDDKLVALSGTVVDIEEHEMSFGTVSYVHIMDFDGYSYVIYYLGELEDVYENVYALPLTMTTFKNQSGGYTEAVVCAGSYVSVVDAYEAE